MPKRKRSYGKARSTKRRKRSFKPRASRRRYRRRIPRGITSQKRVVKLRYCDHVALNPGISLIDSHVFRANGIHDPDYTGTGHQPMFHDEVAALYNHYCVIGSKITVKIQYTANSANVGMGAVGLFLSDDPTYANTVNALTEQNRSNWRMVSPSYYDKPITLTKTFSPRKFFNIVDPKDNVLRIGSAFGSSPTEQASFVLWAGSADTTQDHSSFSCYVMIDYIVMLSEPKEVAQS